MYAGMKLTWGTFLFMFGDLYTMDLSSTYGQGLGLKGEPQGRDYEVYEWTSDIFKGDSL